MDTKLKQIDGSVYQHFKGGYYLKLFEAKCSETGKLLVIYQNLNQEIFARPKEMFEETVDKPDFDYKGPRFKLMEPKKDGK